MATSKLFTLQFHQKEQVGKVVHYFNFSLQNVQFDFLPGQYIQMILPHDNPDERGSSRFFTIASAPHEPYIMIATRQSSSSFKKCLFALKKGDTVKCFGPMGTFVLEEITV